MLNEWCMLGLVYELAHNEWESDEGEELHSPLRGPEKTGHTGVSMPAIPRLLSEDVMDTDTPPP